MNTPTTYNGTCIVHLADVQHIKKRRTGSISVIMKTSTWNREAHEYNNAVFFEADEAQSFIDAWLQYRVELDEIAARVQQAGFRASSALVERHERFRRALESLVEDVELTGGLVPVDGDGLVPVADPEWFDLADTYLEACAALDRTPKICAEEA